MFGKSKKLAPILSGVGAVLRAEHRNRTTGKVHGHEWEVRAWFYYDGTDAEIRKYQLEEALRPYQGTCLPDALAWAEQMVAWLAAVLNGGADCRRATISRHQEMLYAEWMEP